MKITNVSRGKTLPDGSAEIEVETDTGPVSITISINALRQLPIFTFNLVADAEVGGKSDPNKGTYYSFPAMEARIGVDPNGDALVFLVIPGTTSRLAFQFPAGDLTQLKTDVEFALKQSRKPSSH